MSAATLTRSPSAPTLVDRVVLGAGLALVAWSRTRTARRIRIGVTPTRLTSAERASRIVDPYSAAAVHGRGLPPQR